jgi:hypothetical protein
MICLSQTGHHDSSKCMSMGVGDGKVGDVWGFKCSLTKKSGLDLMWKFVVVAGRNGQKVKRDKSERSRPKVIEMEQSTHN